MSNIPTGYKQTEVGVIPEEWTISSIKNVAIIKTGPFGTMLKASEYSSQQKGVPVISVGEIRQGYIRIVEDTPFVCDKVTKRLSQYVLSTGNIVFARKGGVDRSAVISEKENGWFLGSDGIALSLNGKLCSEFLGFQFGSDRVQQALLQRSTGTTMPSMNQEILGSVEIVLPPLPEQKRIAQVLGDVDALIQKLEAFIAKKRDIKQAAMQELLTGKRRLPGFNGPWETKKLHEISGFITKGATPTTSGFRWEASGVLFLRSECVSEKGLILDEAMHISLDAHFSQKRSEVFSGDILITITGNVGRVILVPTFSDNININQHIAIIRITDKNVNTSFIYHYMKQPPVVKSWLKIVTGQAYPQISLEQVRDYSVPLPFLPEQTAIAQVLSDMDAELAQLETRLTKTRDMKAGLMQELLTGKIRLGVKSNV